MSVEAGSGGHWFEELASHMGSAYLRYSFTKGTVQEVGALTELLGLGPEARVLDVGCGPGRHALALAAAGCSVLGIDISAEFVALAEAEAERSGLRERARFLRRDAADLAGLGSFDAVISLCQGAFGLSGGPGARPAGERELDEPILAAMAGALAPSGRLAVSAFSAYFQLRYLEAHDTFDAEHGVNHERTSVRNSAGLDRPAELWTTCFTPRELRLLARAAGLRVDAVYGVTPGHYGTHPATIDSPEFLLLASRPAALDSVVTPKPS